LINREGTVTQEDASSAYRKKSAYAAGSGRTSSAGGRQVQPSPSKRFSERLESAKLPPVPPEAVVGVLAALKQPVYLRQCNKELRARMTTDYPAIHVPRSWNAASQLRDMAIADEPTVKIWEWQGSTYALLPHDADRHVHMYGGKILDGASIKQRTLDELVDGSKFFGRSSHGLGASLTRGISGKYLIDAARRESGNHTGTTPRRRGSDPRRRGSDPRAGSGRVSIMGSLVPGRGSGRGMGHNSTVGGCLGASASTLAQLVQKGGGPRKV